MSEFLLLGTRPRASELSPRRAADDLVALQAWHRCLRRWGLLRSFALAHDPVGPDPASTVRTCLIVQASGDRAAKKLAAGWGRVSGYRVSVLRLRDASGARGRVR